MTQLKAAEQINAVDVSEEQQKNANMKEALEEQLFQPREAEQQEKQVAQLGNEIEGKQGAMYELREANQLLTLASKPLKAAAVPEKEETLA